jgi:hypothetical protein
VLEALQRMSAGGERSVRLVVNSRMDLGGDLGGADQLHLGALPAADAQELLLLHAGKEAQWTTGHAAQLAQMCGSNPVALTLVGGAIAARRCTPKVGCHQCVLTVTTSLIPVTKLNANSDCHGGSGDRHQLGRHLCADCHMCQ